MKKCIIIICSVIVMLLILPLKIISISDFPEKITVNYSGLMDRYGWNIYKKFYSTSQSSGRAFCTSFWNLAPYNVECTKTNWSNNANENIKASAAIGSIINSIRSSNASISEDNYFYGEIAINKFLSDIFKNEVNNINSAPQEILKKINTYVNNAKKIYQTYYNNDDIFITEIKFNSNNVKLDNSQKLYNSSDITLTSSGKYIIKATMKCMDLSENKNGISPKQIKCDLVKSNGGLWVDGIEHKINDNSKLSVTYSGNYAIINYDITDFVKSHPGKNITVKLNFSNKRLYYYAQRYNCGGNYQTITPNYLKTDYSGMKYRSVLFTLKPSSPPPDSTVPKTCEEQITDSPSANEALYNDHKNDDSYGRHLLDVDNPSCDSEGSSFSSSCEKTIINNEWVQTFNISGKSYNALCNAQFNFDNLVKDKTSAIKGDLIFNPDNKDNTFGTATLNYECVIPGLYNTGSSGTIIFNNFVPKLSINIFGDDISLAPITKSNIRSINSNECSASDESVSCNYSGSYAHKIGFIVDISYVYNNDRRYFNSDDKIEVNSIARTPDNLYGYGIEIPDDINDSQGTALLNFDLSDTVFQNVDKTEIGACSYDVVNDDIRKKLNFRTIDVANPFNKIDGTSRYTGGNWCGTEVTGDDVSQNSNDIVGVENIGKINYGCIYDGDLNGNGIWDEDDVEILQKYLAEYISLTDEQKSRADIDGEIGIKIGDATMIKQIVAYHNNHLIGDINMDSNIDTDDLELLKNYINNSAQFNIVQKKLANIDNSDGACQLNQDDINALENYLNGDANSNLNDIDDEIAQDTNESEEMDEDINDSIKENVRKQYCQWNNNTVQKYITNRPSSNSKDEPLYSFRLTASDIKEIREYNKNKSYNESKKNDDGSREFVKNIYSNNKYAAGGICKNDIIDDGICKSLDEGGA